MPILRFGLLVFYLLLGWQCCAAQPLAHVPVAPALAAVEALPDTGYTWDRIRRDTTLAFAPVDSLRPTQRRRY